MTDTCLFLGTGSSAGVPEIGCECAVCTSTNPRNQRLRTSALLTIQGKRFLIDVGPDFRTQALRYGVGKLDGLILTHTHYDHIAGIDELRIFYLRTKSPVPMLLSRPSMDDLKLRYNYMFHDPGPGGSMAAKFDCQVLDPKRGEVTFLGTRFRYFTYLQGGMEVTGLRHKDFAYVSDIREYPETIYEDLKDVKMLVLSALRYESSHVQLTVDEAVDFAQRIGAQKTYFVHTAHDVDYDEGSQRLPNGIEFAYDGLTCKIN